MVSREALIKYGTLAFILFFIFESFFPLLYAPAQHGPDGQPTPTPFSFQGLGVTTANVTRLDYVGYAECSPEAANTSEYLKELQGVKSVFYTASGALAAEFYPNASVEALAQIIQNSCGSLFLRSAFLDVSAVRLTSGNTSQFLTQQHLRSFAAQNGLPYLRGFVFADTRPDSVVNVTVNGVISNNALVSLTVRETSREVKLAPFDFEALLPSQAIASDVDNTVEEIRANSSSNVSSNVSTNSSV